MFGRCSSVGTNLAPDVDGARDVDRKPVSVVVLVRALVLLPSISPSKNIFLFIYRMEREEIDNVFTIFFSCWLCKNVREMIADLFEFVVTKKTQTIFKNPPVFFLRHD